MTTKEEIKNELKVAHEQEVLGKSFKIYGDIENPLFLAKDVAVWIEHSNASVMLNKVDENEKTLKLCDVNNVYTTSKSRKTQEMWFLTEDGLYEVLMQSRKPIAKSFKKEVKNILKTIRKTGGYVANTDMMVNTYFGALPTAQKELVKGLFLNIEEQQKTINEQNAVLEEQKPLVTFAEKIMASNETLKVREVAKLAYDEGINIGQNKLYKKLREWGLILKDSTEPSQRGMNSGFFKVTETLIVTTYGSKLQLVTRVLPKGQIYIVNRLLKEKEKGLLN